MTTSMTRDHRGGPERGEVLAQGADAARLLHAADAAAALCNLYDARQERESLWSVRFSPLNAGFVVRLPGVFLALNGEQAHLTTVWKSPADAVINTFEELRDISRRGGEILVRHGRACRRLRWEEYDGATGARLEAPGWRVHAG